MNLLQISSDASMIAYVFFGIVFLLIYVIIARWIFRVDTNTRYNKMQVDLLAQIAKQQGVPLEEIYKILGLKIKKQAPKHSNQA